MEHVAPSDPGSIDAVVLRTTRYGEADVIANVLTAERGRCGVIAKGARRTGSRLGVRLEPFLVVRLQLHVGRGDLAIVRSAAVVASHDRVRSSWQAQQVGADALELIGRITVEHEPAPKQLELLCSFLAALDSVDHAAAHAPDAAHALLAAFECKLLWVTGILPQLRSCVRCGGAEALVAFSAVDGGVCCTGCRRSGDASIDPMTIGAADMLLRRPLAELAVLEAGQLPEQRTSRAVIGSIVGPTCVEHAGVRPRSRA